MVGLLASSSHREIIDLVLQLARVEACFGATVSSEEVARGKAGAGREDALGLAAARVRVVGGVTVELVASFG